MDSKESKKMRFQEQSNYTCFFALLVHVIRLRQFLHLKSLHETKITTSIASGWTWRGIMGVSNGKCSPHLKSYSPEIVTSDHKSDAPFSVISSWLGVEARQRPPSGTRIIGNVASMILLVLSGDRIRTLCINPMVQCFFRVDLLMMACNRCKYSCKKHNAV